MGQACEVCGKTATTGNQITTRGRAKYLGGVGRKITGKTKRKFRANIQRVRAVVEFNRGHTERFDGIHLDIEPQQRPENKGPGNLVFLPGLVEAYREVRALAEPAQLTVNADIQNKLLKIACAVVRSQKPFIPNYVSVNPLLLKST